MNISTVLACAILLMSIQQGVAQSPEPLAQKWDARFAAPGTLRDIPTAVATDAAGDVYVAGIVEVEFGGRGTVLKFAGSNGALLWRWESSSGMQGGDTPNLTPAYARLAISPDGSPIALFEGANELVKLRATDGAVRWLAPTRAGPAYPATRQFHYALAVDSLGDVLAVGTGTDASVGKFRGSDGTLMWTYEPAGATTSYTRSVIATPAGDVVVTGSVRLGTPSGPEQTYTAKLSGPTGAPQWLRIEPVINTSNPGGRLVQTDAAGDVIIATYSNRLLKYRSADGAPVWERTLSSAPLDLLTDAGGYVYTAAGGSLSKIESASGSVVWTSAASPASTILLRENELLAFGWTGSTFTLDARALANGQYRWTQWTYWDLDRQPFTKAVTIMAHFPDGNVAVAGPTIVNGQYHMTVSRYGPGPSLHYPASPAINWVLPTKAQLQVHATGNGRPGTIQCEYGPTPAYGSLSAPQSVSATSTSPGPRYTFTLEGLAENTLYHARFTATTDRGTTTTADLTFTTHWDANKDNLPDEWELLHWGNTIFRSATTDEDRDGLTSLMEYALGTNPRRHDSAGALPIVIDADERLSITLPKQPYVGLHAEVSGDLTTWLPGEVAREDETTITIRDFVPRTSATARFLRVRAHSP